MGRDDEIVLHDVPGRARGDVLSRASLAIAACPRVRLAWVFGSFLEDRPFRDLDIAVQFYGPPGWEEPGDVASAVWEAIGRPPYDVDIVPLNDALPFFRKKIMDGGRLLFEREAGEAVQLAGLATTEVIDLMEWKSIMEAGR